MTPDMKQFAAERLLAYKRRVSMIRKRVIVTAAVTFALLWAVLFVQLVSGHDPALSKTTTVAASSGSTGSGTSSSGGTTSGTSSSGGTTSGGTTSSTSSSGGTSTSSSSSNTSSGAGTTSAVTTSQS